MLGATALGFLFRLWVYEICGQRGLRSKCAYADAVYVLFLCEVAFRHSNYNSTFLKLRALGTTTYAEEDQAVALV
ncbi:hypothetical protein DFH08DRAFT_839719 [Mycena albidolilacea]|uniref:Secreted protein n=1 Tax=Mycena albidolilacea TaxID=1033008 RepID=A0AAD7AQ46_9AGAR|nr:hypothetical protein DFH08DRAFT_839719 [Mycena albidolilacea]